MPGAQPTGPIGKDEGIDLPHKRGGDQETPGRTSDPLAVHIVPRLPRKRGGDQGHTSDPLAVHTVPRLPRKRGGDQGTPGRTSDPLLAQGQSEARGDSRLDSKLYNTIVDVPAKLNFFVGGANRLSPGHHTLRLTCGPAGNRTATGSLSATSRTSPYQLLHRDACPSKAELEVVGNCAASLNFRPQLAQRDGLNASLEASRIWKLQPNKKFRK